MGGWTLLRLAEPRSDIGREMHLGFYFDFNTEEKLTVMFSMKVIVRQRNATDLQPKTDRKTDKYLTADERR